LLVWVTVTSAVPPPLSFTSQVKVLPFSFFTSLGHEADEICVVEVESDEFSIPISALLASTVSLPHATAANMTTAARLAATAFRAFGGFGTARASQTSLD
jgi:hypothetical protein